MKKILYTTNVPAPYRTDFFNMLGKKFDLTVTYDEPLNGPEWKERNNKWFSNKFVNFKGIFIKHHRFFKYYYSFDVIKMIKKNKFDCIIIGGYSSLTSLITMIYLKTHKIKFILNFYSNPRSVDYNPYNTFSGLVFLPVHRVQVYFVFKLRYSITTDSKISSKLFDTFSGYCRFLHILHSQLPVCLYDQE